MTSEPIFTMSRGALLVACLLATHATGFAQDAPAAAPAEAAAETSATAASTPTTEAEGEGTPAPDATPSEAVQAQYRDVVMRAITEYDAGRWAEARALFLQAHELWPSARTYRTLGMTSFELRNYVQAMQELQAALDDPRRPLEEEHRAQVASLIDRTRAFVGRYRVRLDPSDAQLLVNGKTQAPGEDGLLLLDVGTHELIARAPEHAELRRRVVVQGREDAELALTLTPNAPVVAAPAPAPAPAPAAATATLRDDDGGGRLWTWVAGGAAVVLGATSTGLWLASKSAYDDIDCAPSCDPDATDTSKVEDLETAHHWTAGAAIVAGVGAVVLYFVEGDTESPSSVALRREGDALVLRGRF